MTAATLFVYGTLCRASVRRKVLGRAVRFEPARLSGYVCVNGKWPYLLRKAGASVHGQILKNLGPRDWKRLNEYEDVEAGLYIRRRVSVGAARPFIYLPVLKNWPKAWR